MLEIYAFIILVEFYLDKVRILNIKKIELNTLGFDKQPYNEKITILHVGIDNIKQRAEDITKIISDTSWISVLNVIEQITFEARVKRTIEKLINEVLNNINDKVTEDFGQYLVSVSSQEALCNKCNHSVVPLAELIKEKITGNPGFDFHTETNESYIAFGEAKYSSGDSPYSEALIQISDFIEKEKDKSELLLLSSFVSVHARDNFVAGKKAFVAAFSINAKDIIRIFVNILNSEHLTPLLKYQGLYLIGVEVIA